jgi:hypothetical protein
MSGRVVNPDMPYAKRICSHVRYAKLLAALGPDLAWMLPSTTDAENAFIFCIIETDLVPTTFPRPAEEPGEWINEGINPQSEIV